MDRQIVYPGAIPLDTDILSIQRNMMVALGYLAQATLGTTMVADGLACAPTSPASMVVNVGQGSIISLTTIDSSAFGSLNSDSNPLVKVGVNAEGVTPFTLTAPGSSGQSINYLIEATFQEADGTSVVLPYYNPANPAQPYSGPSNSGVPQNTQRTQRVELQMKAGAAATTGTQTTPAVDSGWVGLYVITVAFGAATVTAGNISVYPSAPFINYKLPQLRPGFASGIQVYNTAGTFTFTVPPGVTSLELEGWGNGGAGSGNATNVVGSAGGSGAYGYKRCSVTPGQQITVTIPAAASGGASGGNDGANGGTCSFGSFMSVAGGSGGPHASNAGAAGGAAPAGVDIAIAGCNCGGTGSASALSGGGAEAPRGGGGGPNSVSGGGAGIWPGGGGGAGVSTVSAQAGGNGALGGFVVRY